MPPPFVRRLVVTNYKSIESCDLELGAFTVLVGRNGAGKSNILDSLRFVSDALNKSLEFALRERGGLNQVRRRVIGPGSRHTTLAILIRLDDESEARYTFSFGTDSHGLAAAGLLSPDWRVIDERCAVLSKSGRLAEFTRDRGSIRWTLQGVPPAVVPDRLALVAVSGASEFRPVFDALSSMVFHNLNPEAMKRPQRPEAGDRLAYDGHNIASVVKQADAARDVLPRVLQYLLAIGVPMTKIDHRLVGDYETLVFAQPTLKGLGRSFGPRTHEFGASSMSDGTMRAFGILVSVLGAASRPTGVPCVIGIEEPEASLHPAATGVLVEALFECADRVQIIISSHSPELLDHVSITPEMIRVVVNEQGVTRAGMLSPYKVSLLSSHLSSAGELLRLDQLTPDPAPPAGGGVQSADGAGGGSARP